MEYRFFLRKNFGENLQILLTYNRNFQGQTTMKKNVHPLISPKIRMAKVRIGEKLQKQILDQTPICGEKKANFFYPVKIGVFLNDF